MARVPVGVEPPRRGCQFENRQKTRCSQPPGRISPCFACLIQAGLIKVATCRLIRIIARQFIQVAPVGRIQVIACESVQVAACEFTKTARRELVKGAQFQDKQRAANGFGSPRRPLRPHHLPWRS